MPYCANEALVSALGPALASFLLRDDSQETDETEVGQLGHDTLTLYCIETLS